jgi:hypothetical protein
MNQLGTYWMPVSNVLIHLAARGGLLPATAVYFF